MDEDSGDGVTRRNCLATVGAVGGGLLAGCVSGTESAGTTTTATEADGTATGGGRGTSTTGGDADGYSVSMVPTGTVTFEEVPETWVANNGSWADMGVALGLEPPEALWLTGRYHTSYYDAVPGVSADTDGMTSLYQDGVSKERFYALDADVHVMDPNFLVNRFKGWDRDDVAEIREDVGPFVGNSIYARHYPWHDDYRYYTLYEGFEKLAATFRRTDRYEAFVDVHDAFTANLEPVVPARGERPAAAVFWGVGDQPEQFYPYLIGGGTGFKHLRDLGVRDALAETDVKDFRGSRAAVDLETLLEVDPEVLLLRGYETKSAVEFRDSVVAFLRDDPVGSELTAVRNGDVYRAGGLYQGPITNMVLTERTAGQLYGFEGELFDRERVAAIVDGAV